MNRVTIYPTEVPRTEDFLRSQQNAMVSLGALAQAVFGTATIPDNFVPSATNPPSLNMTFGPGSIYQVGNLEASQWSILPADAAHTIIKQGIALDPTALTFTAPTTVGYAQNFLVQAAYQEQDDTPVALSYYNSLNPSQPFVGPNNTGAQQNTRRAGIALLSPKAGVPAVAGTQQTPAPDAGYVGLYVVTVPYGTTALTLSNLTVYQFAPFIPAKLQAIPGGVQAGTWTYCRDSGSVNAIVVNPTPAIQSYAEGQGFRVRMLNAPTGPCTINVSGNGAVPLVKSGSAPIQGGEWQAGDIVDVRCNGAAFMIGPAASATSPGSGGSFATLQTTNLTMQVPSTKYPTIQAAVYAAGLLFIAPNVYVTIQVAAGYVEYLTTATGPIYLTHAHGQRCKIVGAPLNGAFPTANDLGGIGSNANCLTLLRSRFQVEVNATGVNAFELHSGSWNSIQNILVTGDGSNAGGHYGIKVGDWSTEVGLGSIGLLNVWVHGFGLDCIRAEESSVVQAVNVGATYAGNHGFHFSHYSVLECNVGNICAMYCGSGVALQNGGQCAIDSASGTIDMSYNTISGLAMLQGGVGNLYSATGVRIRSNGQFGILMAMLCTIVLPYTGSTAFSGNPQGDIVANLACTIVTYGCGLPDGASPARGSSGNSGCYIY